MATNPIILCVDSEPSTLSARKALLENVGYIVLASKSVEHALVSLRCVVVDSVLLDSDLPYKGLRSITEMARRVNPRARILLCARKINPPPGWTSWVDCYVGIDDGPDILLQRLAEVLNR